MKLRAPGRKPIMIPPVLPSAGEKAAYRRAMLKMIDAMHASVKAWASSVLASSGLLSDAATSELRKVVAVMAKDFVPEKALAKSLNKLAGQWKKSFKQSSKDISKAFAKGASRNADLSFRSSLKRSGFAVEFQKTPAIENALEGIVAENVELITSIPEEYFDKIQELVQRSVEAGRSMAKLTKDLENVHGMTRRRAELIARDQNNKATAIIHRLRQSELGITHAQWIHTSASKNPREEHAAWGDAGEIYNIEEGMYSEDDGEFVWPGTPINCGCTCLSVVPGADEGESEEEEGK